MTMNEPLYKYYSPSTAINHVLKGNTIKWSTPFEFNDPFDNQFSLQMETVNEQVIDDLIVEFEKLHPVAFFDKDEQRSVVLECIEAHTRTFPDFCSQFRHYMDMSIIFCLSESYDNTTMWAHYASNHTGVVIEFLAQDPDSPLPLAKKVKYVQHMPVLKYADFMGQQDVNQKVRELLDLYTLTKSIEWSYEKEWRIVTVSRKFEPGSLMLPFNCQEIRKVYLGCNIQDSDKDEILNAVKSGYSWVEVYEGRKSTKNFSLEFNRVL